MFDNLAQMNNKARDWLENVCNIRVHGTTDASQRRLIPQFNQAYMSLREVALKNLVAGSLACRQP